MNWYKKQVYVCGLVEKHDTGGLVEKHDTVTKTVDIETSRRKYSYIYFLPQGDQKVPVCKNMFLLMTGISEAMIYN